MKASGRSRSQPCGWPSNHTKDSRYVQTHNLLVNPGGAEGLLQDSRKQIIHLWTWHFKSLFRSAAPEEGAATWSCKLAFIAPISITVCHILDKSWAIATWKTVTWWVLCQGIRYSSAERSWQKWRNSHLQYFRVLGGFLKNCCFSDLLMG